MECNSGKTAAVREGLAIAEGDWVIVQDADLEYSPGEISDLLDAAESSGAKAVYGRRPSHWSKPSRWLFVAGVLGVDLAIFVLNRGWVRDHATCYKLVDRELLRRMRLESTGFEGCVEITAKLMRMGIPIRQIPIQYEPRTHSDGKKLTADYGLVALKTAWKYRHWKPDSS
jgi:glycosyltransferase involved in cell wall biosynthesis